MVVVLTHLVLGTGKRKSGQGDGGGLALGVGRVHARRVQHAQRDLAQRKARRRPVRHVPVQRLAVHLAVQVLGEHLQHEHLLQAAVVAWFALHIHRAVGVVPDRAVVHRLRFTCTGGYNTTRYYTISYKLSLINTIST